MVLSVRVCGVGKSLGFLLLVRGTSRHSGWYVIFAGLGLEERGAGKGGDLLLTELYLRFCLWSEGNDFFLGEVIELGRCDYCTG